MLGQAALAMWWNIEPARREEFEHWHSHEHFPERLALPGFLRASRWADATGGEGFFVLYELATHEVLASPGYLASLNAPSAWSRQLMPHHRNMVRSQCRVVASRGSGLAGHAITVRLSPVSGAEQGLRGYLMERVAQLPLQPGVAGADLLVTDTPEIGATTEQKIRGLADRTADWIFIVTGYEASVLARLVEGDLSPSGLSQRGAATGSVLGRYQLRLSMVPAECGQPPD